MRIVLSNASLSFGGAERVISGLANYFASQGHDVGILLLFKKGVNYQLDSRVSIAEPSFLRAGVSKAVYGAKCIAFVRREIRRLKPEVILDFAFPTFFLAASRGLNVPVIVSVRNNPRSFEHFDRPEFRRLFYRSAASIVAQTQYAADLLYAQTRHRQIVVIPNPVKAMRLKAKARRNVIVSVGRLVEGKGHADLLKAFASVASEGWSVTIVGDGPLRCGLEAMAGDLGIAGRVAFVGFQENVDQFLEEAEIFALPSYSEGFPNTLLEAMAAPLACVSYDCNAGPRDLIEDGVDGLLVTVGDVAGLASALGQVMADVVLRRQLQANAVAVRQRFAIESIGARYVDLFSSVREAYGS